MKLFARTLILLAVSVSFACAGCRTFNGPKDENKGAKQGEIASKVGEKLLMAFLTNEAEAFIRLLPGDSSQVFTENDFKKTHESLEKQFGKPVSYAFVTNLEHPIANVSIWRVRFERKSSDNTKTIHQEVLFKALSTKNEPETLIGFNFL